MAGLAMFAGFAGLAAITLALFYIFLGIFIFFVVLITVGAAFFGLFKAINLAIRDCFYF